MGVANPVPLGDLAAARMAEVKVDLRAARKVNIKAKRAQQVKVIRTGKASLKDKAKALVAHKGGARPNKKVILKACLDRTQKA